MPPFALSSYSVAATQAGNPLNLIEGTFSIARDSTNEISSVSSPSFGQLITASHDAAGRLTSITGSLNGNSLTTGVGFDGFGRKASVTHSTGLAGSYVWDSLDRPVSITWSGHDGVTAQNISEVLHYNTAGNITAVDRESGTLALGYDNTDQVTSSSFSASTGTALDQYLNRVWQYDATGNRIQDSLRGAGVFKANSILSDGFATYVPDSKGFGNVVRKVAGETGRDEVFTYRTDAKISAFARLDAANEAGNPIIAASYAYDALGRRVAKTLIPKDGVAFTQSFSHFGEEDRILFGRAGNGAATCYVDGQGIDEHLGDVSSTGATAYASDHLGSLLNGAVAGSGQMFAIFGESSSMTFDVSSATPPVLYGLAGREHDPEMRKIYMRNREQDPEAGRFLSQDPIGFEGGDYNFYRYVENSPAEWIDPWGLWQCAPGINCDFTPAMRAALDCFDRCTHGNTAITSGRREGGGQHGTGQACDANRSDNPSLSSDDAARCTRQCFPRGYGQEERNGPNSSDPNGTHFHLQLGTVPGGRPRFAPEVRPYQPSPRR
ncbi:MAG: RHS repeat-associated core domain-containing protein [Deltaproteobacteria bacterium]|nr:RHS repeat-associated core domain-containing protein [Deltaproteobacteria bacterium]